MRAQDSLWLCVLRNGAEDEEEKKGLLFRCALSYGRNITSGSSTSVTESLSSFSPTFFEYFAAFWHAADIHRL
ncbi:MAG TPA: hypothetical protein V6C97_08580 [Oculatellaceae cyanobacterium]